MDINFFSRKMVLNIAKNFFKNNPRAKTPPYKELLSIFKLESLELRRLKSDLTLFHKYLQGLIELNCRNEPLNFRPSITRGDPFKIVPPMATTQVRYNSFFIRTSRIYKDLPKEIRQSHLTPFNHFISSQTFENHLKCSL